MRKWWNGVSRPLALLAAIFGLAACSGPEEIQIKLEEKRALHDEKVASVERRLKAIETGDSSGLSEAEGGGGFMIWTCVCTYRRGTSPPTSCSDPRCGGARR
jgi:hypothetical protein